MIGFRTRVIGRTVGSQGLNRISTAYSNRHSVERLPSCLCECAKSQILISRHQLIDDGWSSFIEIFPIVKYHTSYSSSVAVTGV